MSDLLTKREVAQFLSVSDRTIERYVKQGKLQVQHVRGSAMFRREQVEALQEDLNTPVHRAVVAPDAPVLSHDVGQAMSEYDGLLTLVEMVCDQILKQMQPTLVDEMSCYRQLEAAAGLKRVLVESKLRELLLETGLEEEDIDRYLKGRKFSTIGFEFKRVPRRKEWIIRLKEEDSKQ